MKRWFALLLALALTVSCVPMTPAHAQETDETIEVTTPEDTVPEDTTPEETIPEETLAQAEALIHVPVSQATTFSNLGENTNDALFAAYVDSVFYPNDVSAQGVEAGKQLTGDLKKMYDGIVYLFQQVAAGEREEAYIAIGKGEEYNVTFTGGAPDYEGINLLMDAFLSDLAYEQYWFDKVSGFAFGYDLNGSKLASIYFYFAVAECYQGDDWYLVDTAITGAATRSAANARQIVQDNADKSDYDKLVQYKKTLCDLVSYDYAAAGAGNFSQNNNPWQMIYAFDGDPDTNIVCEGYSKAYMYLCDQTDFANDSITCYLATGSAGGPHMWNIVRIDNKSYLVDITNSDEDSIAQDGGAFLSGCKGSIADGYLAPCGLYFFYDQQTTNLWGTGSDSILLLESQGYVPKCVNGHTPGAAPTCTEPQVCTVCSTELAPALGHTPGTEATCTTPQICTVCGNVVVPALGHTELVDAAVPPTCTEPGLTEGKHCDTCRLVLVAQEVAPATGHTPGPEPTADAPQVCLVCGVELQPKLPHIKECTITTIESAVYTGSPIVPTVTVTTPGGDTLTENTHYTLTFKNNTAIGKATITITGMGIYGGTDTKTFTIVPAQVQNLRVSSFTGTSVKVAFDKVPSASTYRIYVDGKLKGSTTSTSYTIKSLKAGTEYQITVEAGKKVSKTTYYGALSEALTVKPTYSIVKYTASLSYTSTTYDGTEKLPTPKLKNTAKKTLVLDTDYTVTYENNLEVGKASVTFTGIGKYSGSITKIFTIKPGKVTGVNWEVADPTSLRITFNAVPGAQYYQVLVGGKVKATVTEPQCLLTNLKTGTTYKITVKAGATADDKEYLGAVSASVSAKPTYDLTKCSASLSYDSTTYSGKAKKPSVTVLSESGSKLKKDTHYTVSYKSNKSIGTATVTVKGKGKYAGTITLSFNIVPGKVSTPTFSGITGNSAAVKWKKVSGALWYRIWLDGEPLDITTSTSYILTGLEAGRTYLVEVQAGKTVNTEDYCGLLSKAELTPTWELSKYTLKLESDKLCYTGEAVIPVLTLTDPEGNQLTEGVDFSVSYKNNTKIGKASLTLKGIGKYRGSITKSFQIVPAQVENVALVSVTKTTAKISFDKVPSASTYRIYVNGQYKGSTSGSTYTIKKLKAGTEYEITVMAAKKVSKATYYGPMSQVLLVNTTP